MRPFPPVLTAIRILGLLTLVVCIGGCASLRPTLRSSVDNRPDLWHRVVALRPGIDLLVHRRDSPPVFRGTFLRADDDTLVVVANGMAVYIAYDVVTQVSAVSGRPWKRNIGWGIAGGVLYGLVVGGFYARDVKSVLALSGLGTYIGAIGGTLSALATPTTTVVYATGDTATPLDVNFVPSATKVP